MSEQAGRRSVSSEQLIEHLRQILEVPAKVIGATIACEVGQPTRIDWQTYATPAKGAEQ